MKKISALLLVIVMAAALLAGCSSSTTTPPASPSATPSASAPASAAPSATPSASASGTVKTGLAIINSVAKSTSAGDKDGLAEADSTIIAVTVDSTGKITDCVIDAAQSKVNFDAKGALTTPLDTTFKTKNELGPDYGLGKQSGIGKEWNEQAAAFAKYVIGKTADEVKNIAVTADGHASGSDLTASVTIHVVDFINGVQKAVSYAQDLGAKAGDKLSVATVTNIASSKNATADAAGLAQVYSTYVAITKDASGKITSCIFDASQSNVNFDTTGKITTDLTAPIQTKDELKEAYGLKKASTIGKEWYEQAAAFAAYVTGKTIDEVKSIAVTADGHASGSDLTASVTIHVADFIKLITKAAA